MTPRDMAEGCIFLSSIRMLGVHSFPRDTFLKTLEKIQGSGIRQHRLIGIPFRKVWGVQNSKKKRSSTWSHNIPTPPCPKGWVCWGNTAPCPFYMQEPLGWEVIISVQSNLQSSAEYMGPCGSKQRKIDLNKDDWPEYVQTTQKAFSVSFRALSAKPCLLTWLWKVAGVHNY